MSFNRWQKLMAARMVTAVRPADWTPARRRADSFIGGENLTQSEAEANLPEGADPPRHGRRGGPGCRWGASDTRRPPWEHRSHNGRGHLMWRRIYRGER